MQPTIRGGHLLGLVMIVKNEAKVIERCLTHALPFIDCFTICDTGSTDDTRKIIWKLMRRTDGQSMTIPWTNFSGCLNYALAEAKGTATWQLRLDADMVMKGDISLRPVLEEIPDEVDCLFVAIKDHGQLIWLPLLSRGDRDWTYREPTHEYLDLTGRTWAKIAPEVLTILHIADGGNRAEKFQRDIELYAEGVKNNEVRAIFYTAQSHYFLGQMDEALALYERRMRMGEFEEERWYASYMAARIKRSVDALLTCYRHRPWRPEPLVAAARIIDEDGHGDDFLFLEPLVYRDPQLSIEAA